MCSFVTLRDRPKPVVVHPTAINAQAGGAVMAYGKLRITGRVVLNSGE
jgi:hypothetical protein